MLVDEDCYQAAAEQADHYYDHSINIEKSNIGMKKLVSEDKVNEMT